MTLFRALGTVLAVAVLLRVVPALAQADPFATPESTLATYIAALKNGDRAVVKECFDFGRGFHLSAPVPVEHYTVRRRVVLGPKDVEQTKSNPFETRAREGDVRLDVRQVIAGKVEMYSYWLRNEGVGWKIYTHAAWDQP